MGLWAGGQVEVESHDRSNLTLPSAQQELVQAVVASIPQDTLLIVAIVAAGAVDFVCPRASAVLQTFYPGALHKSAHCKTRTRAGGGDGEGCPPGSMRGYRASASR